VPLFDALPKTTFDPALWVDGKRLMGKKLAELLRQHIKEEIAKTGIKPGLAVILVGDDAASQIYVAGKEKAALELGFDSRIVRLPANATQEALIAEIHRFNLDASVHGILVQLPLPAHLNESQILQAIVAEKDADGFHYLNQGRLAAGIAATLPCTPAGIALMLRELAAAKSLPAPELAGRHAVVVGRSNIVGKPMAQLLLTGLNMTVTMCHSKTHNLQRFVADADVLVSATGVRGVIDEKMIKSGAIVIDVGMHRIDGKVTGDLIMSEVEGKASYYTPVPGGVGPMTIAMLLFNTYQNAQRAGAASTKLA
jgi:methylenetetrahydrofolate dehydrogenase (NADP+)/methenyltetrahydrofolate cyclohydrolase